MSAPENLAHIRYGDHTSEVDLTGLASWRLRILRDEAGTAGDETLVANIGRILADRGE